MDALTLPTRSITLRARLPGCRVAWFLAWRREGDHFAILAGLRIQPVAAAIPLNS